MGVIIRQSFKASTVMYVGAGIGVINRLYLLPKYLSPEQIGLIDLLLIASLLFSSIFSFGVIGSLVKFYNKFKHNLSSFLSFLLFLLIIGFIAFLIVLIQGKESLLSIYQQDFNLISNYYYYLIPFTFAFILKGFFSNFSIINQRATIPAILGDVGLKLGLSLLLVILGLKFFTFSRLIFSLVLVYLLMNLLLIGYCVYQFKFKLSLNVIEKKDRLKVYKYSLFVLVSGMSGYVSQFIDTTMVGALQGLEYSGIYSIAFFLGLVIEMPKRAISSISLPIIVRHFDNNEYAQINKLYKQSSINQAIVGGLFLFLIYISLDEIFYLIPSSEKYSIGKNVAIIIGLSRWIDMITGVNSEILRSSRYYLWDLITILIFIIISIVTNLLLIPIYGLDGAATASLISILFYNLVRIFVLYKLYQFNPFSIKTIHLILVMFALFILYKLIPNLELKSTSMTLILLLSKTFLFSLIFSLTIYKLKISTELNYLLKKILKLPM